MSSLNKITLFIWLWICIQPIVGIRTDETPLFDPFLSAKSISLGKSANLTHKNSNKHDAKSSNNC